MKGKEIIEYTVRGEMPDLEQVRAKCHQQAVGKAGNKRGAYWKILAPVAACAIIALAIAIPTIFQTRSPGGQMPPVEQMPASTAELAIESKDLDIFYVTEQGGIASKSVYLRCTADDVFAKWVELNGIGGVSILKCFYDDNGTEIVHEEYGDPSDPITPVEYIYGDHTTLHLTLSQEFAAYADGENGSLLVESLENTFFHYISFDEFDLIVGQQADSQNSVASAQAPPVSTGTDENPISGASFSFNAKIIEIESGVGGVLVEPLAGEDILRSSDCISFSKNNLDDIGASVGDIVTITYTGVVMESYPAQIIATKWVLVEKAN